MVVDHCRVRGQVLRRYLSWISVHLFSVEFNHAEGRWQLESHSDVHGRDIQVCYKEVPRKLLAGLVRGIDEQVGALARISNGIHHGVVVPIASAHADQVNTLIFTILCRICNKIHICYTHIGLAIAYHHDPIQMFLAVVFIGQLIPLSQPSVEVRTAARFEVIDRV